MSKLSQSPRGTHDILPADINLWQLVEQTANKIFGSAGFSELRTPIFEHTEVFVRSAGDSSDIVNKELYTFNDRSDRSLSLRPEGTAGIVRAYLSNGLNKTVKPVKLWYQGEMFRYERSQTGRYRQFSQIGMEAFGSKSPYIEFECINLALQLFDSLGLKLSDNKLLLEINFLGDMSSRAKYQEVLKQFLLDNKEHICKDCQTRLETNPLRALDCKNPDDQALYQAKAPLIKDYLSDESKQHRDILLDLLDKANIPYNYSSNLVRGLDYYTDTVFEIKALDTDLGQQNTICAGGRYDNLVKEFGGEDTPAFGWALGEERLVHILQSINNSAQEQPVIYIINEIDNYSQVYSFVQELRKQGYIVLLDYEGKSYNKQFDHANKLKANYVIHYCSDKFIYRDMSSKERENINSKEELLEKLTNH